MSILSTIRRPGMGLGSQILLGVVVGAVLGTVVGERITGACGDSARLL